MKPIDTELQNYNYPRMVNTNKSNAYQGHIAWSPIRSLWVTTMTLIAIIGGYFTVSIETISVFLVTTGVTICFGHSLGMHRLFIHHSFECPKWLEYLLVYLGVLVGLAGPISMMQTHDLRDWAQRQQKSHPYFGHKTYLLQDAFWQIDID
jgi:stearoyl-CoA desaturase (delta-9 desaturase)